MASAHTAGRAARPDPERGAASTPGARPVPGRSAVSAVQALRAATAEVSATAARLAKLADGLSGAICLARATGLTDEQIADHLAALGSRESMLATLAIDTDGSAVRYMVASFAAEPDSPASSTQSSAADEAAPCDAVEGGAA
jgi:hypothetical protein